MLKTYPRLTPLLLMAAFVLTTPAVGTSVYAQDQGINRPGKEEPAPKVVRIPRPPAPPEPPGPDAAPVARIHPKAFNTQEKAIAVRPEVHVTVCVRRGAVKVNGWDRKEVRVFQAGGNGLEFKVRERDKEKKPSWVEVLGYESSAAPTRRDPCVTGETIEIDVPYGASVAIKGLSSETSVDGIRKAAVEIVGGDIYLNKITDLIDASTKQGGVTVNNSKGRMAVETTTGNIVAFNTESVEAGDYFKAKTRSGSITMQSIGQKEIAASTISGSINYIGTIENYGRYEFTTTNGLLNIVLPEDTCFALVAVYGGRFISDFPVDVITEDKSESAFLLRGKVGECEANLSLKSFSGTIRLRKRGSAESTIVVVP